jgi:protein SCO1/2
MSSFSIRLVPLLLLFCTLAQAGEVPLPGDSIYRLPVTLQAVGHEDASLASLAGEPVVITMFYSSCTVICPVLTLAMQKTAMSLMASEREHVHFVMVTLDDEHDTAAVLAKFVTEHHIDTARWTVAHATAGDVRLLAAALAIRYRKLPDGSYSHSSVLTLLDAHGAPRAHTEDLTGADPAFLSQIQSLLH